MQPVANKSLPVLSALDRVLASPGFARNQRLSALLKFLVEEKLQGKEAGLKEAVIGAEVFGRQAGYDTRADPVVRMEALKLRARLDEYYLGPGAGDPVKITVPKGGYIPQWHLQGSPRSRKWLWIGGAVALLSVVSAAAVLNWSRIRPRPAIAVLPFLNLSPDPDNAYLSDGLADEITGLLSQSPGLDVTARTSSFALKQTQLDARKIGAQLNATLLVEGSVQRSGDQIKVIAQLIRASDGTHIWSETYERRIDEIFSTETEIAASIAASLRLKLGVPPHRTENRKAFELYLRGREAFDVGSVDLALRYFEEAASVDSNLAPAYAGIADAVFLKYRNGRSYAEAHQRAITAAEKALALDPSLPDAYTALGEIKTWDYAFADAERAFRRAIVLNANDARAHASLGHGVLAPLGRFDEAVREIRRAVNLNPLSVETSQLAQLVLLMAGRYEDAEREGQRSVALDPSRAASYPWLSLALSLQGKHAQAIEMIRLAKSRAGSSNGLDWPMACVLTRAGQRDEALRVLQENVPPTFTRPPVNRRLFLIYSCLIDKEHAIEYAEAAFAEHDLLLPTFLSYPVTAWLRKEPAIASLRQRIGLPE